MFFGNTRSAAMTRTARKGMPMFWAATIALIVYAAA
jgi:hypothetical protein